MAMRETYTITVTDAANRHETRPISIRLRTLLKLMLRGFGLRCTDIREVKPSTSVAHDGNERQATELKSL